LSNFIKIRINELKYTTSRELVHSNYFTMRFISFFIACFFCVFGYSQSLPSVSLNGSGSYVRFDNPLNFGSAEDFSIELKVKTNGWSSDPAIFSDKNWDAGANAGLVISANTNGSTWKFNVGNGAGNRIDLNNGGMINDGLWHHLTVTFDRDGAKRIYQDGKLLQTSTANIPGSINGLPFLCIGQDGTTNYSAFFPGQVADVRVWSVALDSSTVKNWICQPISSQHPEFANLLHHWGFVEGAGTTVGDQAGTTSGTLVGNTTWISDVIPVTNANFTITSNVGQFVEFGNSSANATSFVWNFGDGSTSTVREASHQYANPGTYNVALIAKGLCNSDTFSSTIIVGGSTGIAGVPGAGEALDFDGTNDYVVIPNSPSLQPTDALTVEAWIKPRSFAQWESVLSFAQDNGTNESGFDISWVDEKLRFRCATVGMTGNAWNAYPGISITNFNEWMHVAGVYDGATLKFYLNGILAESINVTGNIDWEFNPIDFRIGMFHDDNESYYYDGQIDEVRFWNTARTDAQIRAAMCQKLTGDESGLQAYWRFDEQIGNVANDQTTYLHDGALVNMTASQDRILSGAAIGDTSVYIYTNDWQSTASALSYAIPATGVFEINQVEGNPGGIHLYIIDSLTSAANQFNGYVSLGTGAHLGVFPTTPQASYELNWNYGTSAEATAAAPKLALLQNYEPGVATWSDAAFEINQSTASVVSRRLYSHRQFVPAKNEGGNCVNDGYDVSATNVTFSQIQLNWDLDAQVEKIEYGSIGFNLSNGKTRVVTGVTTQTIDSLEAQTPYDFYLQAKCGTELVWYGPFTFSTLVCTQPAALQATNLTSNSATLTWEGDANLNYKIQWGPAGFALGIGIQIANAQAPYQLNGLGPNKNYDFYVQADCGTSGASTWVGPFTFTTATVGTENQHLEDLKIYPNPSRGFCEVQLPTNMPVTWSIVNQIGVIISSGRAQNQFKLYNLPTGYLTLILQSDTKVYQIPVIVVP
jgi:hypothetical protein